MPTLCGCSSTTSETVIATMTFARRLTHGIDLHRRPGGNLQTWPDMFALPHSMSRTSLMILTKRTEVDRA